MYCGNFEGFGSGELMGWVRRKGSDQPVRLRLDIDGAAAGEHVADWFRQDLAEAREADGCCAFFINVPREYLDDQVHTYKLTIIDPNADLVFPAKVARFAPHTRYVKRNRSRSGLF